MQIVKSWPYKVVAGLLAACAVTVVGLAVAFAEPGHQGIASAPVIMHSASSSQLARGGLTLSAAVGEQPKVDREAAVKLAQAAFPDVQRMGGVGQIMLVRMSDSFSAAPNSCLCWAIDMTPPGGLPIPGPPGKDKKLLASWFFVFVNAQTGAIQLAESG